MEFNLFKEMSSKIKDDDIQHPKSEKGVDGEYLHGIIQWIDQLEDDSVWESFTLPLQCWYNDNLLEFENEEAVAEEKNRDADYVDPIGVDNYDPSQVNLDPQDLLSFDRSLGYTFVIATEKNSFIGEITDVDIEGSYVAMKTIGDTERSFNISDIEAIRLCPTVETAHEVIIELQSAYPDLVNASGNATNKEKEEIEVEEEGEAKEDKKKTTPKVKEVKVKEEKTKSKTREKVEERVKGKVKVETPKVKDPTKAKPIPKKAATVRFKELMIKNTACKFPKLYELLQEEGYVLAKSSAVACYADTLQTMKVMNSLGLTQFALGEKE